MVAQSKRVLTFVDSTKSTHVDAFLPGGVSSGQDLNDVYISPFILLQNESQRLSARQTKTQKMWNMLTWHIRAGDQLQTLRSEHSQDREEGLIS